MTWLLCSLLAGTPLFAGAAGVATQPSATQPARVSLHARGEAAAEVLKRFSEQAGALLPLSPPDLLTKEPPAPVTIDADGQPFWAVLETFGKKTGLEPVFSTEDPYPRFQLGQGGGSFWAEPHVVAGPVVLFATDVVRTNTVELRREKHRFDREITLNLTAFAEPGMKLLWASPDVTLKFATDEQGQSLVPPPDGASEQGPEGGPAGNVFTWDLVVALNSAPKASRSIARLVGQTVVRCQTDAQRVEVEDVMKARNVVRRVAGVPFTFYSLKKADIEYVLRVGLRREKKGDREWMDLRHSIYNGQFVLLDDKGRQVAGRGTENGGEYGNNAIDATLRFIREPGLTDPQAGEPYRLVWLAPTASKDIPVEFEFRNLPIPE